MAPQPVLRGEFGVSAALSGREASSARCCDQSPVRRGCATAGVAALVRPPRSMRARLAQPSSTAGPARKILRPHSPQEPRRALPHVPLSFDTGPERSAVRGRTARGACGSVVVDGEHVAFGGEPDVRPDGVIAGPVTGGRSADSTGLTVVGVPPSSTRSSTAPPKPIPSNSTRRPTPARSPPPPSRP